MSRPTPRLRRAQLSVSQEVMRRKMGFLARMAPGIEDRKVMTMRAALTSATGLY